MQFISAMPIAVKISLDCSLSEEPSCTHWTGRGTLFTVSAQAHEGLHEVNGQTRSLRDTNVDFLKTCSSDNVIDKCVVCCNVDAICRCRSRWDWCRVSCRLGSWVAVQRLQSWVGFVDAFFDELNASPRSHLLGHTPFRSWRQKKRACSGDGHSLNRRLDVYLNICKRKSL